MMWIFALGVLLGGAMLLLVLYVVRRLPRSVGKVDRKGKGELEWFDTRNSRGEILRNEPEEIRKGVQPEIEAPEED